MTKEDIILFGILILLGLIFASAFIWMCVDLKYSYDNIGHNEKVFCPKKLVLGGGAVSYCNGNPFVCNYLGQCNYVTVFEDCHTSGGKARITHCDAISLTN